MKEALSYPPSEQFDRKNNLPEKTSSELEAVFLKDYLSKILRKQGEIALAELAESNKINLELEKQKAIETGNAAENINPDGFNPSDHMQKRAELIAEKLIENKGDYLQ